MSEIEKSDLLKGLHIERDMQVEHGTRKVSWIIFALVALAFVGAVFFVMRSRAGALPVRLAVAQPIASATQQAAVLDATGYVTARRAATVSAQITGTLTEVLIEEGDHVDAGQVLARVEDSSQKAALAEAQAQVDVAKAVLMQYEAQLAQNQRDEARLKGMVDRQLVSQQAVQEARTQVVMSVAQLMAQQKRIDLARATLQTAQVQYDYCTVRAPFSGVVIAKAAQVGEIVSPFSAGGGFTRTGIGTIVDTDSLEVEVDINEAYIGRVGVGHPVESVLNAYPDWKIPSHVIAIIPTADRSKATVRVRVGIDVKDARIVPDMGVRVSFLEQVPPAVQSSSQRGVLVPASAVRTEGDVSVVFVMQQDTARRRAVSLGRSLGGSREVLSGLVGGDMVVAEGPAELKDGDTIAQAKP